MSTSVIVALLVVAAVLGISYWSIVLKDKAQEEAAEEGTLEPTEAPVEPITEPVVESVEPAVEPTVEPVIEQPIVPLKPVDEEAKPAVKKPRKPRVVKAKAL